MALQSFVRPWPLIFSFVILYVGGRTPFMGDQPVERPLPVHKTTQTRNKCTLTFMPRVRFKPTTPVFERAQTVHALDHGATVIGKLSPYLLYKWVLKCSDDGILCFILLGSWAFWNRNRRFKNWIHFPPHLKRRNICSLSSLRKS
jgi:hypothetical protein